MAKRPATSRKALSQANLTAMGADRMAELLMEMAASSPGWKRRLRMELAAQVGAPDLALELDKRLNTLATSQARVSWRKRPELMADLLVLKTLIVDRLAVHDVKLGLDRLVAWFDLYPGLSARVKDPKGELALLFDEATGDLAAVASRAGPQIAGPVLGEALSTRLLQWAAWVGRGAGELTPSLAQRLLSDLTQGRPQPVGRLALVVRKLADRSGDLDIWIQSTPEEERRKPEAAAEIARRLAKAGRAVEARTILESARHQTVAQTSRGRADRDAVPTPLPEAWWIAEIAVLEAEGSVGQADDARWSLFERSLSPDQLRTLVGKLADFEDVVALDRAFHIAAVHGDAMKGLAFLIQWPALREAADLVLARRNELRGAVEDVPLWAARLAGRYPAAALLLWRARARALVNLGSEITDEVRGLISEAESLHVALGDAFDGAGHEAFLSELEAVRVRPARRGFFS